MLIKRLEISCKTAKKQKHRIQVPSQQSSILTMSWVKLKMTLSQEPKASKMMKLLGGQRANLLNPHQLQL